VFINPPLFLSFLTDRREVSSGTKSLPCPVDHHHIELDLHRDSVPVALFIKREANRLFKASQTKTGLLLLPSHRFCFLLVIPIPLSPDRSLPVVGMLLTVNSFRVVSCFVFFTDARNELREFSSKMPQLLWLPLLSLAFAPLVEQYVTTRAPYNCFFLIPNLHFPSFVHFR